MAERRPQRAGAANPLRFLAWLLKWDARNQPYPELATAVPTKANGGISKDGLTITYRLRKGVKWSDGAPFDADDVVFSTAVVNDPASDEGTPRSTAATRSRPLVKTISAGATAPFRARWTRWWGTTSSPSASPTSK
ncbi:MAG: peptide/nickel transport system substrate-binding protein [Candidatus Eremiobacteraeota bacterium]|nr:peptide/nickel transport system substrate-binding protein [Candidatus Eremiobacteraeota bacterium]